MIRSFIRFEPLGLWKLSFPLYVELTDPYITNS
jgi:hypothetical protein